MKIGVPREIKNQEFRVGLTPESVQELTALGHEVMMEAGAGAGIGADDARYQEMGARIVAGAPEIFKTADLIVKVKEPQAAERKMLRDGQILFTYLHLAADREQTTDLIASGVSAIAYETVRGPRGDLPLLAPMSRVAGRLSVQAGASALEMKSGGRGILLGGVPGVAPARVTIIGGGVVGFHAATIALGMGADVTVLDKNVDRLAELAGIFGHRLKCLFANSYNLNAAVLEADLVIGAVLLAGGAAPKLVTRGHLKHMRAGSVIVDVAVDQGGCFETTHPTTHEDPVFVVDRIIHYCVANMPGAVPRTSTYALNNATLPFVIKLAQKGMRAALLDEADFAAGLNVHRGQVTMRPVAEALDLPHVSPGSVLN